MYTALKDLRDSKDLEMRAPSKLNAFVLAVILSPTLKRRYVVNPKHLRDSVMQEITIKT